MSETMDPMAVDVDQQELARKLLARAKEHGAVVPSYHLIVGQRLERIRVVPKLRRQNLAVISSNNAVESVDARYRRAVKAREHFPTEQAALKCL